MGKLRQDLTIWSIKLLDKISKSPSLPIKVYSTSSIFTGLYY